MTANDSSFQSVRVMLDTRLPHSAMIVVSSACDGDGQAELAGGIVHAFSEAGRRTALVSLYGANGRSRSSLDWHCALAGPSFQAPLGVNELDELIKNVRSEHEVVVVVSPPIVTQSTSLHLCRTSDGVLLAVRLGRKVTAADQSTIAQLKLVSAKVLGVIAMRPPTAKATEPVGAALPAAQALEAAPTTKLSLPIAVNE